MAQSTLSPEYRYAQLVATLTSRTGVSVTASRKKGFGSTVLCVNDKVFALHCPPMMKQNGPPWSRASQSDLNRCSPESPDIMVSGCVLPILHWKGTLQVQAIETESGFHAVEDILVRIERGMFA
jgi:hypothetical protein